MPRMPKPEAETLILPHGPMLVECVRGGVDDYFTEYSPVVRTVHRRRTRANIICDHIIQRAMAAFGGVAGINRVRNATRGRYTLLSIEGRALLRFKYLGPKKRSRNVKTQLAKDFTNNQVNIDGLPAEATRFDVGYVWNALQTQILEVLVSCPTPTGVEYVISLWTLPTAEVLPFPTPQAPDTGAQTQVVVADQSAAAAQEADGPAF